MISVFQAEGHATLFYLELITRITVANRDRVMIIWRGVSDHISRLISATAPLADGVAWFERLQRGEPGLMKVILEPGV